MKELSFSSKFIKLVVVVVVVIEVVIMQVMVMDRNHNYITISEIELAALKAGPKANKVLRFSGSSTDVVAVSWISVAFLQDQAFGSRIS